jgi:hypothetical protein
MSCPLFVSTPISGAIKTCLLKVPAQTGPSPINNGFLLRIL